MKVASHLIFAECCWFATTAIVGVHYETPAVLAAAATSILSDADYPRSWLGYQLGSISECQASRPLTVEGKDQPSRRGSSL